MAGRSGRYRNNCPILIEGMRKLGFATLLPDRLQAPIIVTFHMPADPKFVFESFYDKLRSAGYVIYPASSPSPTASASAASAGWARRR